MQRYRTALLFALAALALASATASTGETQDEDRAAAALAALDPLTVDIPVLLRFENTPLPRVLEAVSSASGLVIEIEGGAPDQVVDAVFERQPLRDALVRLAAEHGLSYEVPDPGTLIVHTPWLSGVGDVTHPRIRHKLPPEYPADARAARVTGTVVLQAVVRSDGSVGALEVLREAPPGYGFADSARRAVAQWTYEPAERDGLPVDAYFTIMIRFELVEEEAPEAARVH